MRERTTLASKTVTSQPVPIVLLLAKYKDNSPLGSDHSLANMAGQIVTKSAVRAQTLPRR